MLAFWIVLAVLLGELLGGESYRDQGKAQ